MGVGELHDYVRFAVNTGLRPDEASNLLIRRLEEACPVWHECWRLKRQPSRILSPVLKRTSFAGD